jgi:hypothetical protein
MIGCTLTPEDAYRFARGETVTSSTGLQARLPRPLDFLVVADHAESIGAGPAIQRGDPVIMKSEFGRQLHELATAGTPEGAAAAYDLWLKAGREGKNTLAGELELIGPAWKSIAETADKFNTPGRFTAFIGYEWSAHPNGNNLHRVVVLRDDAEKAVQVIPISRDDTSDPEDLWKWMGSYEKKTGGRALAIPHNGNLSNGLMFDDVTLTTNRPLDKAYAEERMKWEPLIEITQMKGTGEAHPMLSPEDEFADFELMDTGSFGPQVKTPDMLPREYAREALKRGLAYETSLGVNPFKFGFVGSTDAHTALSTTTEDNYFGKVVAVEPTSDPIRFEEVIVGRPGPPEAKSYARQISASGLCGVWARENTREAIWDAMSRKEVFATTGTRLKVRVFAGYNFDKQDLDRSDFAKHCYENGVPMGADLQRPEAAGAAPSLLIRSIRDADGANLDRVQVIKGWLDSDGTTHEKIYDVAVSGDRSIGEDGRCKTPVGNTVNVDEASYTNSIGAPFLQAHWQDPDFDPSQRAFYYVRVIEIPTPRWTTFDAKYFGVELPEDVPTSIQERAFSSPIWYTP